MVIEGDVFRGLGLASKMDFPTINIVNNNNIESGIYFINNNDYGNGVAFVLPKMCEIHFIGKKIDFLDSYLVCDVIQKIQPPNTDGIIDVFYKGIENY